MYNQKTTKIIGTLLKTIAEFKDFDRHKITPGVVKLTYKNAVTPITEEIIVLDANNEYSRTFMLDVPGEWYFRWECDGNYASADEFGVYVQDTVL